MCPKIKALCFSSCSQCVSEFELGWVESWNLFYTFTIVRVSHEIVEFLNAKANLSLGHIVYVWLCYLLTLSQVYLWFINHILFYQIQSLKKSPKFRSLNETKFPRTISIIQA